MKTTKRKSFLTKMLRRSLSKVMDDPKVRQMLTPEETENDLDRIIERVVNKALEEEIKLGRKLTFQEFRDYMMKTLDEIAPKAKYIV